MNASRKEGKKCCRCCTCECSSPCICSARLVGAMYPRWYHTVITCQRTGLFTTSSGVRLSHRCDDDGSHSSVCESGRMTSNAACRMMGEPPSLAMLIVARLPALMTTAMGLTGQENTERARLILRLWSRAVGSGCRAAAVPLRAKWLPSMRARLKRLPQA